MSDLSSNPEIQKTCEAFQVKRLHVFGSAVIGEIDTANDINLLVESDRWGYKGAFDQLMSLKEALETVLGKPIDLMVDKPESILSAGSRSHEAATFRCLKVGTPALRHPVVVSKGKYRGRVRAHVPTLSVKPADVDNNDEAGRLHSTGSCQKGQPSLPLLVAQKQTAYSIFSK